MRKWNDMSTDEMYAIWHAYMRTDFNGVDDPLRINCIYLKTPVRITAIEHIKLTDELFNRLMKKEGMELNEDKHW